MQMMLLVASQALKDSASKNENYATSSLISTKKQTKKIHIVDKAWYLSCTFLLAIYLFW